MQSSKCAVNGRNRRILISRFRDPRDPREANQPQIDILYSTPPHGSSKKSREANFQFRDWCRPRKTHPGIHNSCQSKKPNHSEKSNSPRRRFTCSSRSQSMQNRYSVQYPPTREFKKELRSQFSSKRLVRTSKGLPRETQSV